MELTVRAVRDDDELMALFRLVERAFYEEPLELQEPTALMRLGLDRTAAAFIGNELVGAGRNFPLELVVPGGARLPMAAVSWISTSPTHRRRGVMSAVMNALLADARANGDPVLGLLASEGSLYERFGFGVASLTATLEVERATVVVHGPPDPSGRCRLVPTEQARETLPSLYERLLDDRPGGVNRPTPWWSDEYFDNPREKRHWHYAVHEDAHGEPDGYASYTVQHRWPDGIPRASAEVMELLAATPEAHFALWRHLLDLDLVEQLRVRHAALDDPIHHALDDRRRVRVVEQRDQLWLRVLDVEAVLSARTYADTGELVLGVKGRAPDDPAAGTYRLTVLASSGRCERTDEAAEVVLDVDTLSALVLGGTRFSVMARAARVDEIAPGALARADAMFAADPLPQTVTWF